MVQASQSLDRSRRGLSPLLFGTVLFLASETLFFGGLFAAYFSLRSETSPWPPAGVHLDVVLGAIATAMLVASSFTLHAGLGAGRSGRHAAMRRWVLVSIALGLGFIACEIWDWVHMWTAESVRVSSNAYSTLFYAMTGFHGLHVLAGIVLMLVVLGRLSQGAYRDGRTDSAEAVTLYWHFVDVVWIGLFVTIFLVR